jgi:hypothetical protein
VFCFCIRRSMTREEREKNLNIATYRDFKLTDNIGKDTHGQRSALLMCRLDWRGGGGVVVVHSTK